MRSHKILLFLLLPFHFHALAQSWFWGEQGYTRNTPVWAISVAIDGQNNGYLFAQIQDSVHFGSYTVPATYLGNDVCIVKYDTNGNVLWAKGSRSSNSNFGYGVAADAQGNSYITGRNTGNTTFDSITIGSTFYLTKYSSNGKVAWVQSGDGNDNGISASAIAISSSCCPVVTGQCGDTAHFGATYTYAKTPGIFIARYDTKGNLLWVRQPSKSSTTQSYGICCDKWNNIFVAGVFSDSLLLGSCALYSASPTNFVLKLDSNGTVIWAQKAQGTCGSYSIGADNAGNVYMTGGYSGSINFGPYYLNSSGDIFIVKYNSSGDPVWAIQDNPVADVNWTGESIAADNVGHIYLQAWGLCSTNFAKEVFAKDTFSLPTTPYLVDPELILEFDTSGKPLCGNMIATQAHTNSLKTDPTGNYVYVGGELAAPSIYGPDALNSTNSYLQPVLGRWKACTYNSVVSSSNISEGDECTIYVPDAFSPNNDGQNDILYVRSSCINSMDFVIFDRWGNKVFESQNINSGWDGTYLDRPMNTGTYVYTLRAVLQDGSTVSKHGNIALIR